MEFLITAQHTGDEMLTVADKNKLPQFTVFKNYKFNNLQLWGVRNLK